MESSPTRTTRDLLLKVVPTAAHVSFHLAFEPSQACSPRPLAVCSFRPSYTPHPGSVTGSANVHGPTGPGPVHRDPILPGFHSGHEGEGQLSARKTELDCDPRWTPRCGELLGSTPGGGGVCVRCTLFMEIHFVHPGVSFGPWKLRGEVNVHAPYAQSSCLAGSVHLSGK